MSRFVLVRSALVLGPLLLLALSSGSTLSASTVGQGGAEPRFGSDAVGVTATAPPAITSHIRSSDPEVVALIATASEQSYTVSRLIGIIEDSDVIVYLEIFRPPKSLPTSQTRLVPSGAVGARFVRILIDIRLLPDQQIELLAHELQHVVEICRAPEIQTSEDLQRHFQRIGYTSWNERSFETKAALLVQRLVAAELRAGHAHVDRQGAENDSAADPAPPRVLFGEYCAACHGRDGRGKGPAAGVMTKRPPDLTMLSERSGGEFPWSEVERCIRAIDRQPPATLTEGMPVWRPVASHPSDEVPASRARDIAAYVETLQRRPPNPSHDRD